LFQSMAPWYVTTFARIFTIPAYPWVLFSDVVFSNMPLKYTYTTPENAWICICIFLGIFSPMALAGHYYIATYGGSLFGHILLVWMIELPNCVILWALNFLRKVKSVDRSNHPIANSKPGDGRLGKTICIVGNGPSLINGPPLGELIDAHDEVVRFNNFQCKEDMKAWSGSKTTFHFSDAMLFPTFPEYQVEGARYVLPIFEDRISYSVVSVLIRSCIDCEPSLACAFLVNPDVWCVSKADLTRMRLDLGLEKNRTPTSGYIAIDLFSKLYDKVTIIGFDFFQGKDIHYYEKEEPWYERLNNRLGVQFHAPGKEKGAVQKLIDAGKCEFLKGSKQTTKAEFAKECEEEKSGKKDK